MKMTNLDDAFNVESTIIPAKENVGITPEQKPDRLTKTDIDKDYEYTRGNLYSIIEKGLFVGATAELQKLFKTGLPKDDK